MTRAAALYGFFSSFGIPAVLDTTVQNVRELEMPYLIYQNTVSGFSGGAVFPSVQLWYRTESEAVPNAKAQEIYDRIGEGILINCDGGCIKIEHGTPWMVAQSAEDDKAIKLRQLNLKVTYYTM